MRIKKFLESKFVKNVSGVRVNYLTLAIYNDEVRREYEDHINSTSSKRGSSGCSLRVIF